MTHGNREVEIKLPVEDLAAARRTLRALGYSVSRPRVFEANTVYDTPVRSLLGASSLLRVRQAGRRSILTYKGPPVPSRHKDREELELELSSAPGMEAILQRLGFEPVFRYEKYRTEFRRARSAGTVTLDETPIGLFMELEGTSRWIDRTARTLGFEEAQYITKSYGSLYQEWCRRCRVTPAHMVFPKSRTRK